MASSINDYRMLDGGAVEAQAYGDRAKCRIIGDKIRCEVIGGTTWGKNKSGSRDEITVGPNDVGYCEASRTRVRCWKVRGADLIS